MGMRYRSVTKVGKGQYITSNYSASSYVLYKIFYYILIFPYIIIFKYLFFTPIKWLIVKLTNYFKAK